MPLSRSPSNLDWPVPDYTTLCRRQKTLAVQIPYRRADGPLNLLVDSTGIKFLGDGEWHAPTKQRAAVAAMLKTIFAQETKAEAEAQWEIVADALREKQPKLGALIDSSRDDVLAYMAFPREHWTQIASTNPLERVNREVKRRADVIGIFPNDEAIIRLVGALMLETNDEWAVARRYMSLETLARVTDNPTIRLSAVTA